MTIDSTKSAKRMIFSAIAPYLMMTVTSFQFVIQESGQAGIDPEQI
jgi:hypothetical protein